MALMKCKHSYATQRLMENEFKFYANRKRILQYPFKEPNHWEVPKLETKIRIGIPFMVGDVNKTKVITHYDDLMRYGIMISKRRPTIQRKFAQKVEYFLTKMSPLNPNVGDIPDGHYIERNPRTREFKLVGDNSLGQWYNPFPRRSGEFYKRTNVFDQRGSESYFDAIKEFIPMQEEEIIYSEPIPEKVMGITEDGKLLCIQEEKENPTTGITGKKRHAKSLCKHRDEDQTYHKWKKRCVELNDVMLETDSYCQKWHQPLTKFSDLNLLNEPTIPLPMVYLHPKTTTLRNIIAKGETGFETYLSFGDFIMDYNNILKGKKEWTFKNAGVYFRNLLYDLEGKLDKDGLYYCKNYRQQEAVVYKKLLVDKQDEQKKTPQGVIPKILNVLKDIDNSKILDSSNNTDAKWTIEFPDGHKEKHYPWTACIIANLVPSIVTHDIKNHHPDFHPQYANFILKNLFNNQNDNEFFVKNKIELFMYFDEILSLVDSPVAKETFETVVRESGHSRIGFTYCSQYWDKIPEFIRSQTDYVISFNQKRNQAKAIVEDFDVMKHRINDLINLKKGEFIIFSSNPLILYDEYGKREVIEDEAIKATIFPSLSAHKAPKDTGV